MRFSRLELKNWKNFKHADLPLSARAFIIGPNASGKSNLLDAFRFLRDVAERKGGLQYAVEKRGGVPSLRSLHARRDPNVMIGIEAVLENGHRWTYKLEFGQHRKLGPIVKREFVSRDGREILARPQAEDESDPRRLTQTHLEQVQANREFRDLQEFFAGISYLHVIPQLVRDPARFPQRPGDPFGSDLLEQLAKATDRKRGQWLKQITAALSVAVPQLKSVVLERDKVGVPHLKGLYKHWRPNAGWQTEEQFSDGTLRLLGMLWSLMRGSELLLLEEPELSLHAEVVRYLPQLIARSVRRSGRQVLVSTHSRDLLNDSGIAPEEVIMLTPTREDTLVCLASSDAEIRTLVREGFSIADAALPRTAPARVEQLTLFGD